MNISDNYRLADILIKLETTLQIDGRDYGERDIDVIMSNIYKRIQRQYQLDLTDKKLTDDELYVGPTRASAILLIDNISQLFGQLTGYTYILKYRLDKTNFNSVVEIKPRNINYAGVSQRNFQQFMARCRVEKTATNTATEFKYIEAKFGEYVKCNEKRLLLIMIVARRLGLNELVCVIADIFMKGDGV